MDYGEKFKRHRRYLQQYFSKANLHKYYDLETREVHRLLRNLLAGSNDVEGQIKRYVDRYVRPSRAEPFSGWLRA